MRLTLPTPQVLSQVVDEVKPSKPSKKATAKKNAKSSKAAQSPPPPKPALPPTQEVAALVQRAKDTAAAYHAQLADSKAAIKALTNKVAELQESERALRSWCGTQQATAQRRQARRGGSDDVDRPVAYLAQSAECQAEGVATVTSQSCGEYMWWLSNLSPLPVAQQTPVFASAVQRVMDAVSRSRCKGWARLLASVVPSTRVERGTVALRHFKVTSRVLMPSSEWSDQVCAARGWYDKQPYAAFRATHVRTASPVVLRGLILLPRGRRWLSYCRAMQEANTDAEVADPRRLPPHPNVHGVIDVFTEQAVKPGSFPPPLSCDATEINPDFDYASEDGECADVKAALQRSMPEAPVRFAVLPDIPMTLASEISRRRRRHPPGRPLFDSDKVVALVALQVGHALMHARRHRVVHRNVHSGVVLLGAGMGGTTSLPPHMWGTNALAVLTGYVGAW